MADLRAENERLLAQARAEGRTPNQQLAIEAKGMKAENERLRARVAELEAAVLNLTGSETKGSPPTILSDKIRRASPAVLHELDALRAEVVRLQAQRQVDNEHFIEQIGQQGAEIAQMQRHHDLFCRCDSIRYGKV